ncbi:hypothetical protein [Isoptericola sp. BMS4]|uniref:hypothetical protein n=1 Tax=Isoptericola sp. BMS4 TaxID=2527875 RepID=UPI001422F87C|nr:hypothetical protein [Isoptericola sp. BMS4]
MNAFLVVLIVVGALVVLVVGAVVGFFGWTRWKVRQGLATQRREAPSFPAWGSERGLTYAERDDELLLGKGLEAYNPFRFFAVPGATFRVAHVFRGRDTADDLALFQFSAYANPAPDAPAKGTLTVATVRLPRPVEAAFLRPAAQGEPAVHAQGERATCYLNGPLTLEKAAAVRDRLAAYVEGVGRAA